MHNLYSFKTKLKERVCNLLFQMGILHLYLKFVVTTKKDFPGIIINYHGFIDNDAEVINPHPCVNCRKKDFEDELIFIKRNFHVTSLDDMVEHLKMGKRFRRPTVAITADDGFKNNYERMFPIVTKEQVPVTVFLTAGLIDTNKQIWVEMLGAAIKLATKSQIEFDFNGKRQTYSIINMAEKQKAYLALAYQLKSLTMKKRNQCLKTIMDDLNYVPENSEASMLSWNEIREMRKAGITFGAHTMTHPILSRMPLKEAKKEILDSKLMIEEQLKEPVKHFAFPNGRASDFSPALQEFCKDIGFESVSSAQWGVNTSDDDRWFLKRMGPSISLGIVAYDLIRATSRG